MRFALAAGSANDMADVLGGVTEIGLRKTVARSLAELLETLPSGDLARLELAEWHAEEITGAEADEKHVAAIRELAMESATFFAGQDVGPEAIAAIALFGYVSSVTTPTASIIRKIERLVRQAATS